MTNFYRNGYFIHAISLVIGIWLTPTTLTAEEPSVQNPSLSINKAIQIGLEHYEPLKLADEEVELARIRREEAYRNFYPALSLKAEQTKGETADPNVSPEFTERNFGASLTHTLYEGGKLASTYHQSEASYQAAQLSREKTYQDFLYSVTEAYWNLTAAQTKLSDLEKTRDAIREELKKITEQYISDVAVKQQFLAVKSQYLQANTQVNLAKKNQVKSKWDMAKALGLAKPPKNKFDAEIPFKKVEPKLETCLVLASTHRPDLLMQKHLVDISRNGLNVAEAYRKPKINLNTFYGRSASAYDSQDLDYREDWQINATISQSFFGNSVSVNGSDVKTSPKLGQSTRTRVKTQGAAINVLDKIKSRTEYKEADLAFRQAQLKQDDLEKDIAMEVELSYYNVNQSLLQVEFSEEDVKLAEEELNVVKSKGRYGLVGVLEVAQAQNRLSTSRASQLDALANYQIAIAALNRAVGIPDQFKSE